MDLLTNDLSVHEQFPDLVGFQDALARLMSLRKTARRFGLEIQVSHEFLNVAPIPGITLKKAVGNLGSKDQQRAVMSWLARSGPFWDDVRKHGKGEWLQCNDKIVTDSAIGEAAFRVFQGLECGVVSLTPSDWHKSRLKVIWVRSDDGLDDRSASILNLWCEDMFEESLPHHAPPIQSWDELRRTSEMRFSRLIFATDCFAPLTGIPFARCAADRFIILLGILEALTASASQEGKFDTDGRRIFQEYFTGARALFSDSSDSEKRDFGDSLTFAHPEDTKRTLSCTWHGKIPHMTLRLHFSWPVEAGSPIYVVYAGPKITKR